MTSLLLALLTQYDFGVSFGAGGGDVVHSGATTMEQRMVGIRFDFPLYQIPFLDRNNDLKFYNQLEWYNELTFVYNAPRRLEPFELWNLCTGVTYYPFSNNWYISGGMGLSIDGPDTRSTTMTDQLSTHFNFVLQGEIGCKARYNTYDISAGLLFMHWSNAGLAQDNLGLNTLMLNMKITWK